MVIFQPRMAVIRAPLFWWTLVILTVYLSVTQAADHHGNNQGRLDGEVEVQNEIIAHGPLIAAVLGSLTVLFSVIFYSLGCACCYGDEVDHGKEAHPHQHKQHHHHHHDIHVEQIGDNLDIISDNNNTHRHRDPKHVKFNTPEPNGDAPHNIEEPQSHQEFKPKGSFVTTIELSGNPDPVPRTPFPTNVVGSQPYQGGGGGMFPIYNQPIGPPVVQQAQGFASGPPGIGPHGTVVLLNNPGGGVPVGPGSVAPVTLSSSGFGAQPAGHASLTLPRSMVENTYNQRSNVVPQVEDSGGGEAFPPLLRPVPQDGRQSGEEPRGVYQVPDLKPVPGDSNQGGGDPPGFFPKPSLRPVSQHTANQMNAVPGPSNTAPVSDPPLRQSKAGDIEMAAGKPEKAFVNWDAAATVSRLKNMSLNEKEMGAQEEITYAMLDFQREKI